MLAKSSLSLTWTSTKICFFFFLAAIGIQLDLLVAVNYQPIGLSFLIIDCNVKFLLGLISMG